MNFGIYGFPLGPPLLVSCGGRLVGRLTDLFTRFAPISLLGAALCFLSMSEVIKREELFELKLSCILLLVDPREQLSQFFTLWRLQ